MVAGAPFDHPPYVDPTIEGYELTPEYVYMLRFAQVTLPGVYMLALAFTLAAERLPVATPNALNALAEKKPVAPMFANSVPFTRKEWTARLGVLYTNLSELIPNP